MPSSAGATPKKRKPFLTVGLPKVPSAGIKPMWPRTETASSSGAVVTAPSAGPRNPTEIPLGNASAGRPVSNVGSYLIKPTPETNTGFEMMNDTPDVLKDMHEKYLRAFELPPALQPKYIRKPAVMEAGVLGRATNISRGWRKPRSRAG